MSEATAASWLGARRCAPIAASVIPFAIIVAQAAREAGLSVGKTIAMSVVVFAGAAQLTALELAKNGTPETVILGAAILVNLRFGLYSASLSPHLGGTTRWRRAGLSYLLTDQTFALCVRDEAASHRVSFFVGAGVTLWVAWQLGTGIGMLVGSSLPSGLSLGFAVALVFVTLATATLDGWPTVLVGATSVAAYVVTAGLPYGLGLLVATAAGVAVGSVVFGEASP